MTAKQSGETQGESDCKAKRGNPRRKSDCNCPFLVPPKNIQYFSGFPFDVATVFGQLFGRNLPVTLPFFPPASFWLIFLFSGYFLVIFWFFCLFLAPPIFCLFLVPLREVAVNRAGGLKAKVTVKQSGKTQGEVIVKQNHQHWGSSYKWHQFWVSPQKSTP